MTLLNLFRRRCIVAEFQRGNVLAQFARIRVEGKYFDLVLRLKHQGWKGKSFAEIRFADVPKIRGLFDDADRWLGRLPSQK